ASGPRTGPTTTRRPRISRRSTTSRTLAVGEAKRMTTMTMTSDSPTRRRAALLLALAGLALWMPAPSMAGAKIQKGTLIHLADGDVQGTTNEQTRQFLGIPYAMPPIGALRWRPPMPPAPWQSVLQANAFAGACAQLQSVQAPASANEDCLYL